MTFGMPNFIRTTMRATTTTSSTKNVAFGTRKMPASMLRAPRCQSLGSDGLVLREHVDEHDHEQQVDEVHRFDQPDRQEEVGPRLALDLGLPGDRRDRGRSGKAVADGRTDGASAEGESATDKCARSADRGVNGLSCHVVPSFVSCRGI